MRYLFTILYSWMRRWLSKELKAANAITFQVKIVSGNKNSESKPAVAFRFSAAGRNRIVADTMKGVREVNQLLWRGAGDGYISCSRNRVVGRASAAVHTDDLGKHMIHKIVIFGCGVRIWWRTRRHVSYMINVAVKLVKCVAVSRSFSMQCGWQCVFEVHEVLTWGNWRRTLF